VTDVKTAGLGRSYFYQRLLEDMEQLLKAKQQAVEMPSHIVNEEEHGGPLLKMGIHAALDCLTHCPVCGGQLENLDYELAKSCACGDFVITHVLSNGEVHFTYRMNPDANSSAHIEQV